jgi:thiol-disulfide isomerase/thioredoxin
MWASWCGDCVKMPKIKELQANNPDVDYVFISMDKTADKWLTGIDKHELKGDHFMANDQQQGVLEMQSIWIDSKIHHRGW